MMKKKLGKGDETKKVKKTKRRKDKGELMIIMGMREWQRENQGNGEHLPARMRVVE